MDLSAWAGYLVVFTLCMSSRHVTGCKFIPTHPQDQYCSRDFVFMGEVLTETRTTLNESSVSNPGRKYELRIINRMKGSIPRPGLKFTIVSRLQTASCGIPRLVKGQKYVISGNVRSYGNMVLIYDLHRKVSELSAEQALYIFSSGPYSYRRNCQCKVTYRQVNISGCVHGDSACLKETAICRYIGGKCLWQNEDCD